MFEVKANGSQMVLAGGMVRSTAAGKVDFSLAADGVMFRRWAEHLTRATQPPANYPKRNWMLACKTPETGEEALSQDRTLERYRESAFRHFMQWWSGDSDEDHAAAVFFNINGHETLTEARRNAEV